MKKLPFNLLINSATSVGKVRTINEDAFSITSNTSLNDWSFKNGRITHSPDQITAFIVADGMGGEAAGEVASSMAIETSADYLSRNLKSKMTVDDICSTLCQTIQHSHQKIKIHASKNSRCKGMGTTILIGCIFYSKLAIAWVGDSRIYRHSKKRTSKIQTFRSGNLEILSNDHSVVWKKVLAGNLTPEEARLSPYSNIILQSLGDNSQPTPECRIFDIYKGDFLVACTDGLNAMVPDKEIENIVHTHRSQSNDIAPNLLAKANILGGKDNITIVTIDVTEGPDPVEQIKFMEGQDSTKKEVDKDSKNVFSSILSILFRKNKI